MTAVLSNAPKSHTLRFAPLFVLTALILILALLAWFPSDDATVSRSLITIAHPASGASIVAALERNEVENAKSVDLRVEATSSAGLRIEQMRVCVSSPDFTTNPASACVAVIVSPNDQVDRVGSAATVTLIPVNRSGQSRILLTASWLRYVPDSDSTGPVADAQTKAHHRAVRT